MHLVLSLGGFAISLMQGCLMVCFSLNNAPINVMPAGGEAGHRVGI